MPTRAEHPLRFVVDPAVLSRPVGDGLLVTRPQGTALQTIPEVTFLDSAACEILASCATPKSTTDVASELGAAHGTTGADLLDAVGRALQTLLDLGVVSALP